MTDDLFSNLQPATVKEALKAQDAPQAKRKAKEVAAADEAVPEQRTRDFALLVIDPRQLPEPTREDIAAATVGRIAIPEEFCQLDSMGCKAVSDTRHMFSFTKDHGWWVHMDCGQPTKAWFRGAFLDLVETDDEELKWLDE